ncbi:prolyl aminopeptidase [Paracoccus sp. (in: a-proteobacteria)]|uniref:prolyl aminopeptidase n=1 Tax=Paracoccus sp. TaxID=267 RepID=UPI0032208251
MTEEHFTTLRLAVDGLHELHVERHGTRGAIPTVVLHGGPGAGISPLALATIDPARHDIVLFDQRGAGKSTPLAEFRDNTTAHLIADIEAIRRELGFERWLVIGGSWGSFLSLAYAQAHPERVLGLRLHGIFLAGDEDVHWWFQGIRSIFPDHWQVFAGHVEPEERGDLLSAYYRRLTSQDPAVVDAAAWHLRNFSARTQTFEPQEDHVANLLATPGKYLAVSRLFAHYCVHRGFMPPGAILAGIDRIRQIPTAILQGRYDMVTPMASAWKLHQHWPEAGFEIVTLANHAATGAMAEAQRRATDRLADIIEGKTA